MPSGESGRVEIFDLVAEKPEPNGAERGTDSVPSPSSGLWRACILEVRVCDSKECEGRRTTVDSCVPAIAISARSAVTSDMKLRIASAFVVGDCSA
jgi:hypothetical protein